MFLKQKVKKKHFLTKIIHQRKKNVGKKYKILRLGHGTGIGITQTLQVRPLKHHLFLCTSSLREAIKQKLQCVPRKGLDDIGSAVCDTI